MSAMDCNIFNELRLEGKLCDVVITVNGIKFNGHKNILCGCSSYFRALFTSGRNSTEKLVYNIPGVSPEMMRLIIEYAYMRSVLVTVDNVEPLLVAADQFCILGIVRICCDFLEEQLCLENCIGIWQFADFYSFAELWSNAYYFILHNFEEIVPNSKEFLGLLQPQLCDIIEKDDLNVKVENVVFEAILCWIAHDPASRKSCISLLLPKVRMGLMSPDYFMKNVKNNAVVKQSEECKPIVFNVLKAMYDLNMTGPSNSNFHNPLICPRLPHTILLAIGGWSGGGPTNGIEAYDTRADRWVNVTQDEERPRAYHGAAYLKGFVYCVGGFDSINYFNSVCKFNPVTRTWHQVAPMHSRRCYVSVAVLDGCIYAMGGFDGYERLNTAERYEPKTNQWTLVSPMHEQRSDASATTLHAKVSGTAATGVQQQHPSLTSSLRVYICGGFNGNECLFTAECYSPHTNQWTLIAPMGSRRSGVGVVAYGEQVFAVGGFNGTNRLRHGEAYSPLTNAWRAVSAMFNPRSNFGIEVVDNLLFAVGGFNGFSTTFNVECYDKKMDKWYNVHDMAIFRSALSCCVVSGLPNVTQYSAPRNSLQAPREEPKLFFSNHRLSM